MLSGWPWYGLSVLQAPLDQVVFIPNSMTIEVVFIPNRMIIEVVFIPNSMIIVACIVSINVVHS